jgi:hypothetical protein
MTVYKVTDSAGKVRGPGAGVDLSKMVLVPGTDLSGVDLSGAVIQGSGGRFE